MSLTASMDGSLGRYSVFANSYFAFIFHSNGSNEVRMGGKCKL